MTDRPDELQDYVDGRLDPREQAAFEERLRQEPELAHELHLIREAAGALRQDPGGLSPGFYTRARARFEEHGEGARRPGWTWEWAGLVAAALLAGVLFLPTLFRDPPAFEDALPEAPADPFRADQAAKAQEQAQTDRPVEPGTLGDDVTGGRARKSAPAEPDVRSEAAETAPTDRDRTPRKKADRQAPTQPAAPAPPPPPARRAAPAEKDVDANAAASPDRARLEARASRPAVGLTAVAAEEELEGASGRPRVLDLPADFEHEAGPRILESEGDWDAFLSGPGAPSAGGLGAFRNLRAVLLPPDAARNSCDEGLVDDVGPTYRVRLPEAASAEPARGGCLVLLPRNARPIVLVRTPAG